MSLYLSSAGSHHVHWAVLQEPMADWMGKLEALDIPDNEVPGMTMADKPTLKGKLLQLPHDNAAHFFNGTAMEVLKMLRTLLPEAIAGKPSGCMSS